MVNKERNNNIYIYTKQKRKTKKITIKKRIINKRVKAAWINRTRKENFKKTIKEKIKNERKKYTKEKHI